MKNSSKIAKQIGVFLCDPDLIQAANADSAILEERVLRSIRIAHSVGLRSLEEQCAVGGLLRQLYAALDTEEKAAEDAAA